jgi:CBS domain containing-hemolysin-like protein
LSSTNWIELVIAIAALAVMALSSWAETSLVAVSRIDIRRLFDIRLSREDALAIDRTQRLRSSVLLIAMLSAALSGTLFSWVFAELFESNGLLWGILIAIALLIVFGRLIPRALSREEGVHETGLPYRVGVALSLLFAPIVRPVEAVGGLLSGGKGRRNDIDSDDLEADDTNGNGSVHTSEWDRNEPHPIEEAEQDMISGILHLEEVSARQIMVPRIDIVALPAEAFVSEAVDVAMQAGHSRIPVYGRNMDEIMGVIYAKDLLRYVNEDHEGLTIEALMRKAYFVPESKRVDDLLHELQQQKVHLAVVVDEYGGTAGVVTIEDILEEIVGEIQDEYDRETPQFEMVTEQDAIVDGRLSIDDLCDELDLEWPGPVSGTVGGFIQRQLGRIPSEGEVVQAEDIRLTVLDVEHRRVRRVMVERVQPEEESDTPPEDGSAVHSNASSQSNPGPK